MAAPHHHDDGKEHGHSATGLELDPHFWLDPLAVQTVLPALTTALCETDKAHCAQFQKNRDRYTSELSALNAEAAKTLAAKRKSALILSHNFLNYFVKRYELNLVATLESAPGKEITPRSLADIIIAAKQHKVRSIFAKRQLAKKAAEVVAEGAGAQVVLLDPLGSDDDSYAHFFQGLVAAIAGGL